MTNLAGLTTEGIAAVKAGDTARGRSLLTEALAADPNDATAWLWLSATVETTEEKRYCLQQALKFAPGNPAAERGLEQLGEGPAAAPVLMRGPVAQAPSAHLTDRQVLDMLIRNRTEAGWNIVSQSEGGVQFIKKREVNAAGLVLFVVLPAIGGLFWLPLLFVALIGAIIVVADYAMKRQETVYVTVGEVRAQIAQAPEKYL